MNDPRADGRDPPWWEDAVVYQVYPRSFADANGDGIGDLAGITQRLDHLRGGPGSLGVDAIWLSPIFPSPLADFGYDISDYTAVDPAYGTLADFDRLVEAAHARGLRVLLDFVPCHTSDRHSWFIDSRSSRASPRRDWYIWADPAPGGGPPNNWTSVFGGSAWELDPATGQYYLHSFYPEQPDVNWRSPALAEAIHGAMRFWLDRGVDGFRVDAIQRAVHDDLLRDNPPPGPRRALFGVRLNPDWASQEHLWDGDRPEVADVVRGLRRVADEYGAVLVGEVYVPVERLGRYLGDGAGDGFQLAFNFELLLTEWRTDAVALAIERAEALHPPGCLPTYALSNHDQSRHATRWGEHRSRLAAFLLLTMRGVPFLYAGEEIGMVDPQSLPGPPHDRAGRDPYRTPMQWEATLPGGGFTTGDPWLPLTDPATRNVADHARDPRSLLSLYRRLLAVRRGSAALRRGEHRSIFGLAADVIAYLREAPSERVLVLLNMGDEPQCVRGERFGTRATVLVGTHERPEAVALDEVELAPLEGLALQL